MAKLTAKHEKFIQGILEGKSETQAYIDAGYSEKYARQAGSRLYANVDIQGEIQRRINKVTAQAMIHLKEKSLDAAKTITGLAEDGTKDDFCRLQAAKDVLDRTGLKPSEKLEHSGSVDHNVKVEFVGIPDGYFDSRDGEDDNDSS